MCKASLAVKMSVRLRTVKGERVVAGWIPVGSLVWVVSVVGVAQNRLHDFCNTSSLLIRLTPYSEFRTPGAMGYASSWILLGKEKVPSGPVWTSLCVPKLSTTAPIQPDDCRSLASAIPLFSRPTSNEPGCVWLWC